MSNKSTKEKKDSKSPTGSKTELGTKKAANKPSTKKSTQTEKTAIPKSSSKVATKSPLTKPPSTQKPSKSSEEKKPEKISEQKNLVTTKTKKDEKPKVDTKISTKPVATKTPTKPTATKTKIEIKPKKDFVGVKARIMSYRRSKRLQVTNQAIAKILDDYNHKKLVGKKFAVLLPKSESKVTGIVTSIHGQVKNKQVLLRFDQGGMTAYALNQIAEIYL